MPPGAGDAVTATVELRLTGPLPPEELAQLCRALALELGTDDGEPGEVVCLVEGLSDGLESVEVLARLSLVVRRAGGHLLVRGTSPGLTALLGLVGLSGLVSGS